MLAYLITSPKDCLHPHGLKDKLARAVHKSRAIDVRLAFACLRYDNSHARGLLSPHEALLIESFRRACEDLGLFALLNLTRLKLEILEMLCSEGALLGIHYKESDMDLLKAGRPGFLSPKAHVIYSAHSIDNAKRALDLGASYVVLSPIFYEKNGNKALGLHTLESLDSKLKPGILALGGVTTNERINSLRSSGIAGFASISYFD